jgi:hypothetical protein
MCRVEADAAIKGSIKEETLRADWLCVKVNGKWKVLDDAESLFAAFVWD